MKKQNYLSIPFVKIKTSIVYKFLSFTYLFAFCIFNAFGQPQGIYNPCRILSGPILPDLPTLCETISDFDPYYTIEDETVASSLLYTLWPTSGTAFYGKDILIEGEFIIDIPVSFVNCRIKMLPGAHIKVTEENFMNEFLAFNCKLYSCDEMWKGITLENNTRCRLFSNKIEDAQYALVVGEDVLLGIVNNLFNRNFVSITNARNSTTLPFLLLKNNTFDCRSELSDYHSIDFPNTEEDPVSFAGILLNGCSSNIGFIGSNNNFNNLNYGILANNSSISIKGCTFKDAQHGTIIPDLIQDSPQSGLGVFGINSNIIIEGSPNVISCVFDYADLFASSSNLTLTFTKFIESYAVASDNKNGETVIIDDNTFDGDYHPSGISVRRSMASGNDFHTSISHNVVQNLGTHFYPIHSIYLNGIGMPTDFAIVQDNIISFSDVYSVGIRLTCEYSENNIIDNNTIDWEATDINMIGIEPWLGRSPGSVISNNEITGGTFYDENLSTYGIYGLSAQSIEYCNNIIDYIGNGLYYDGNCSNSHITLNKLHHLGNGLVVSDYNGGPGIIGVQDGTKNLWEYENNYDRSALNESSASLDKNLYIVNMSDASDLQLNPTNVDPTDWFIPNGTHYNTCGDIDILITSFDSLIITSDPFFDSLPEPVRFYLEKGVIRKIFEENLESSYSTYLASRSTTSEYILAEVENDLKDAFQMNLSDQGDLDDFRNAIVALFDSISNYDSINYSNIDTVTYLVGTNYDSIQSKLEQINLISNSQQTIKDSRMSSLLSSLSAIKSNLDTLTPRSTFDLDYKNIYLLYLKYIGIGVIDSSEYEVLIEIAQNVADSSFASHTAFAFFSLCDSSKFMGYSVPQLLDSPMEQEALNQAKDNKVESNRLVFKENNLLNISPNIDGILTIFDLSGRILTVKEISLGSNRIEFGDILMPGAYFYTIIESNNNSIYKSGLFTIIR